MRISKTLWQAALLAMVTCSAGAALAQDTAEADAPPTESTESEAARTEPRKAEPPMSKAKDAPARPFIERSLVIAPEQVGKVKLYSMKGFDNPGSGIGVRYQHTDFPTVRIDIFVYPAGRQVRDDVLAAGMREVKMALEDAMKQGKYAHVTVGDATPFDLRLVDEDGSLREVQASEPQVDDGDAAQAMLAAVAAAGFQRGLRMPARLTIQDEPQNSLAFLFYRGLYLVKGRISASPTLLPDEAFDRFANHAMASLVPVIATRSTGGCHQFDVTLPRDALGAEATVASVLATASEAKAQESCAETLDETLPDGHRAMPLVYTPEMWN